MPIYEYVCDDCHAHYEQIVMSAQQKIPAPVREPAAHAAALRIQRGEIVERKLCVQREFSLRRMRLHADDLRLPLGFSSTGFSLWVSAGLANTETLVPYFRVLQPRPSLQLLYSLRKPTDFPSKVSG